MRSALVVVFFLGFIANTLSAQQKELMVQGISPDLYLAHTVAAKENWYSIGRLYNMSPKLIAPYNSTTIDKPLSIGQPLKVPLTNTNFSQNETKEQDEVFVPVFHSVQDKEWMFRISTNYNKVPIENLERWNRISRDEVKAGARLIVGYLKLKKDQSALASRATSPPMDNSNNPSVASLPASNPAVVTAPEKTTEPVVKQEKKQEIPSMPAEDKPVVMNNPVSQPTVSNTGSGGYFKSQYEENGKATLGLAGVFKSTSGWQDGKYYALMNNVAIGTIIKVSNPSNNKTVFAKVLGQLPEMKESAGLTARVSDAAASELGLTASKFNIEVKY
ncbi:MAG: LysM peptidoglycan-binding domain-containing protein [Chitinophagaceae bacterium]